MKSGLEAREWIGILGVRTQVCEIPGVNERKWSEGLRIVG
jgi:hypothetical protein